MQLCQTLAYRRMAGSNPGAMAGLNKTASNLKKGTGKYFSKRIFIA